MSPTRSTTRLRRRGFSILETFVATTLLGTLLLAFVPVVRTVGLQQRQADQQLLALREAENVLETLSARTWRELNSEQLADVKLSETAAAHLPHATLRVTVAEPPDWPRTKRIVVQVSWTPAAARPAETVRLTAWFSDPEVQP